MLTLTTVTCFLNIYKIKDLDNREGKVSEAMVTSEYQHPGSSVYYCGSQYLLYSERELCGS